MRLAEDLTGLERSDVGEENVLWRRRLEREGGRWRI
jgi:hypothetical protein